MWGSAPLPLAMTMGVARCLQIALILWTLREGNPLQELKVWVTVAGW